MRNLYIADLHFNHANSIRFDSRPFSSVEEMNETILTNWNSAVKGDDTVYILGDMFWGRKDVCMDALRQMKGSKVLIRGNHDHLKTEAFCSAFEEIASYKEITDGAEHLVLCHYPIPCFNRHYYGWIHLYGHVHMSEEAVLMEETRQRLEEALRKPCRMYNIGAMLPYMNYTPRTLEEILAGCPRPSLPDQTVQTEDAGTQAAVPVQKE